MQADRYDDISTYDDTGSRHLEHGASALDASMRGRS